MATWLFSALALMCAADAAFVAALSGGREADPREASYCAGICSVVLACGAISLAAAWVAR